MPPLGGTLEHLIKRQPKLADANVLTPTHRVTHFTESAVNRMPRGSKASGGETLWVAEVGYGIYAKGKILTDPNVLRFGTIPELLDRRQEIPIQDAPYILHLLTKMHRAKHLKFLSLLTVEVDLTALDMVLEVPEKCRFQGSWFYLDSDTISEAARSDSPKLTPQIPGAVRLRVYQDLVRSADRHIIDIDHFVPRSVGGPGNLEENLVPISFSLNRAKSNRVPRGVFVIAQGCPELSEHVPNGLSMKDEFLTGEVARDAAKKITRTVNGWNELDRIRSFYQQVKNFHFLAPPSDE